MPPQDFSPNPPPASPQPTTRLEPPIINPASPEKAANPPPIPPQPATRVEPIMTPPPPPSPPLSPSAFSPASPRASRSPIFWALVGSTVTIGIVGAGFYLYGIFLSGKTTPPGDVQMPATAPGATEQKLSVVSDQYFSNLDVIDDLKPDDPLLQQVLPSDFTFEINQYTAPIRTGDGIEVITAASPDWPEIQQELERANLTNRKTIQVRGKDVVIELLEWHAVDFGKKPECVSEDRCGVEYRYEISVNGYQVAMNDKEVRTFLFDDGSKMNMTASGSGVAFMIKVLGNS